MCYQKEHHFEKLFLKYVSMNVMGMLGLSLYILADTWFISRGIGVDGLTALNLALPVYSFVHGSGLMFGMGGASRYSILRGQGKDREAGQMFMATLFPAIFFVAAFVICGGFFSWEIAGILGAEGTVYKMTEIYLRCILLFSPAFILNDIVNCFVRNDGNPRLAMAAMLTGSMMNIILDYIFIILLDWGMFGAVFATGLAPVIGLIVLSRHFRTGKNQFLLWTKKCLPVKKSLAGKILLIGFPAMIGELSSGIVILIFNAVIMKLTGNTGVAAYGIIANISLVIMAVYTGVAQGIQPLQSRYLGEGLEEGRKRTFACAVITVLGLSILFYGGLCAGSAEVAALFNHEENQALQQIAVPGMRIYFAGIFFAGMNIIFSADFAAAEQVVPAHVLSICRGFVIMIPAAFLLAYAGGMTGVWLAFPVTEGCVFVAGSILHKYRHRYLHKERRIYFERR